MKKIVILLCLVLLNSSSVFAETLKEGVPTCTSIGAYELLVLSSLADREDIIEFLIQKDLCRITRQVYETNVYGMTQSQNKEIQESGLDNFARVKIFPDNESATFVWTGAESLILDKR